MDIYVGNLSYETNEAELRDLFAAHGTVASARVVMDKFSGQSKGFGFVEMPNSKEAIEAIQQLNGQTIKGRPIRVNESKPRPQSDNRGGRDRQRW